MSTFFQIILSSNCAAIQKFKEQVVDKLMLLLDEVWQLHGELLFYFAGGNSLGNTGST